MQPIVRSPVFEVVFEPMSDHEAMVFVDGHIAMVEEPVDVRAQREAIRNEMVTSACVGNDVRGIQNGQ